MQKKVVFFILVPPYFQYLLNRRENTYFFYGGQNIHSYVFSYFVATFVIPSIFQNKPSLIDFTRNQSRWSIFPTVNESTVNKSNYPNISFSRKTFTSSTFIHRLVVGLKIMNHNISNCKKALDGYARTSNYRP